MKQACSASKCEQHLALLEASRLFAGVASESLRDLAAAGTIKSYGKGDAIFPAGSICRDFFIVAGGLVRVSIYGVSGLRLTYLLARRGEPINLVSPFVAARRPISAEALEEALLFRVPAKEFLPWALKNPQFFIEVIATLGKAVDSANRRLLDMVEKRVEQRLSRVLSTLYLKFGSPLHVTSAELAELAGTTVESTLRSLGKMRKKGLIRSSRGRIYMLKPGEPSLSETEALWL